MKKRKPRKKNLTKTFVDTTWFDNQIKRVGLNQTSVGKLLGVDRSTVSSIKNGRRRLALSEAPVLADALQIPLEELLERFGMDISSGEDSVRVEGWLDGTLTLRKEGLKGPRTTPYPFSDKGIRAARCQTAGSEYDGLDGALVYYGPKESFEVVGKMALVKIQGESDLKFRIVRKGYSFLKFNLTNLVGRVIEEDVRIEMGYPVVWIKIG